MSEHPVSSFMNWASALSVAGTLLGLLPHVAAGLGAIWYCVLLYDRFVSKKRKIR